MGISKMHKQSDSIFHPPCGSNVPGKVDANPYMNYPPDDLRVLLQEGSLPEDELEKVERALKQWERQYQWPGYTYKRRASDRIRKIAYALLKRAEITGPAQNLNYYQDAEIPDGLKGILDDLETRDDQYNEPRFDIPRQGERPERDIDTGVGDFSTPKTPVFDCVKPRGNGEDPEGMENVEPPTGGDIDGWQQGI